MSPGKRTRNPEKSRRQRTRRFDVTALLAVVLPLATIGALALVHPADEAVTSHPPALTRLTRSVVVCPSARPVSPDALAVTASGSSGTLTLGAGADQSDVPVQPNAGTPLTGTGPLVLRGRDKVAPGLVAGRFGTAPISGVNCPNPAADQWFTGLGARVDHDSIVELVNPDPGPAVADFTLLSEGRTYSVRRLRGLTIPGHRTVTLNLAKVVPRRSQLTAHVVISRGRLAVNVLDSTTNLGTNRTTSEWMPPQLLPATTNRLLGLPTGPGLRTLLLANGTADVVRAQVKIVTGDTSFVPEGMDPTQLAPGTTTSVVLTKVLAQAMQDGAVGIEVTSTGPVTATLTTQLAHDRAITAPDVSFSHEAALALPVGSRPAKGGKGGPVLTADLVLSADAAGSGVVNAYSSTGTKLLHKVVAEQQGRTVTVRLPVGTAFVRVVPQRTPLWGAVVLSGNGAAVIPLHELLVRGLVPQITAGQD
jgi:Family of unknown function (DUF5719)